MSPATERRAATRNDRGLASYYNEDDGDPPSQDFSLGGALLDYDRETGAYLVSGMGWCDAKKVGAMIASGEVE